MTDRPARIQIGPTRYDVLYDRKVLESTVDDCKGVTSTEHQRITIDPDRGPDAVARTLLHEVLHGCWALAGNRADKVPEEIAIRTLTLPLLDTLRRNPDLVRCLMDVSGSDAARE